MSLSWKVYEQAFLYFKPTEATSPVLDLVLRLFTARVTTFEPLVAQLPFFCAAGDNLNLTSLILNRSCASSPLSSNKRFTALRPPFSAQNSGIPLGSVAPAAQPRVKQAHLRWFLDLFFTRKRMGLSKKLYEQALLPFRPTEATSTVLDLNLSLFTARVLTFEPLIAQLPYFVQLTII